MVPRPSKLRTLASLGAGTALGLASCTLAVDSGVTYHACERSPYVQPFSGATTLETLLEECWQLDGIPPQSDDVFVDDGDLVIRVHAPASGASAQWSGDEQGPFVYQAFEGDFLAVARFEVLSQISGDLCLASGNGVGLALRDNSSSPQWATILLEPFMPDPPIPEAGCEDEAAVPVPVRLRVETKDDAWSEPQTEDGKDGRLGVGTDGEADLALCRIHDRVFLFYRDPSTSAPSPEWVEVADGSGLATGTSALDIGFTAKGTSPAFEAEGHFTWTTLVDGIGSDGCRGALEEITLPEAE